MRRLACLALLLPCALAAQGMDVTLAPHVDVVRPARFYHGPLVVGSFSRYAEGEVRLRPFTGWGARLTVRPAGSPWALELDGSTGETVAEASGDNPGSGGSSFRIAGRPARLSLFSLGVARRVAGSGDGGVTVHVAGTLASATFQERYIVPPSPSQPVTDPFETLKPWARRYLSPGAQAGIGTSLRVWGPVALTASSTLGLVRNETGDMGSNQQSIVGTFSARREAYWMPVLHLTLGASLSRSR